MSTTASCQFSSVQSWRCEWPYPAPSVLKTKLGWSSIVDNTLLSLCHSTIIDAEANALLFGGTETVSENNWKRFCLQRTTAYSTSEVLRQCAIQIHITFTL